MWDLERPPSMRQTSVVVAVALIHVLFLYIVLIRLPVYAPPSPLPLMVSALKLIHPPKPPPPPPPIEVTTLSAPVAPFVPPPTIHVQQQSRPVISSTSKPQTAFVTGFAQSPGQGTSRTGGSPVIPPTKPVFDDSRPPYPRAYRNTNLPGFVSVTCVVEIDGRTNDCSLLTVKGGKLFGQIVLDWLADGTVRYKPGTRDGKPVAQSAALKIFFIPNDEERP